MEKKGAAPSCIMWQQHTRQWVSMSVIQRELQLWSDRQTEFHMCPQFTKHSTFDFTHFVSHLCVYVCVCLFV
jgi:hypothetical protein